MAQTTKHHADQVQATVARGSAATSAVVASWRRSSNFHRLDPAECNLPRRLSQAEFELARQQIEPLVRAAQSNLDRLFLAVGGVGCCVLRADRNGVRRPAWRGVRRRHVQGVGSVDRDGLERGVRGHQRDRNMSCRTARAHRPSRPAFLRAQHAFELHVGADLRSRGQACRGARRSSCRADLTEGFVNLIAVAVGDAARRIEMENFRLAFPNARFLFAPDTIAAAVGSSRSMPTTSSSVRRGRRGWRSA